MGDVHSHQFMPANKRLRDAVVNKLLVEHRVKCPLHHCCVLLCSLVRGGERVKDVKSPPSCSTVCGCLDTYRSFRQVHIDIWVRQAIGIGSSEALYVQEKHHRH